MPAGALINFCAAPGSTFDPNTGNFSFMSQDAITYPPGRYTIEVHVAAGNAVQVAPFQLELVYPALTLNPSPFADHV